jgi:NifU-like protein involved in Fe-S cluster formation
VTSVLVAVGLLLLIVFLWFGAYYLGNSQLENPDGRACVTGSCNDTMEISLQFRGDRVANSSFWSNGCAISKQCIEAVTTMALGKTVLELKQITMDTIMDEVGKLPDTHVHCAQLAEMTLHKAVENYLSRKPATT